MNYLKIDKEDVCNGEGLRVVLWLSGCSHKCKGCQNPQTWDANNGIPFDESAKEELFRGLDKDYISGLTLTGGDPLFEGNLNDVLELVTDINKRYNTPKNANKIRLSIPQKSIWLYTGYKVKEIYNKCVILSPSATDMVYTHMDFEMINESRKDEIRNKIVKQCDVIVDGKYVESQRDITLPYMGSKNQRVIDIQQSLQKGKTILWQI